MTPTKGVTWYRSLPAMAVFRHSNIVSRSSLRFKGLSMLEILMTERENRRILRRITYYQ